MEGRGYSQWRRVVLDSHHFGEEQNPDLDPLLSEESKSGSAFTAKDGFGDKDPQPCMILCKLF